MHQKNTQTSPPREWRHAYLKKYAITCCWLSGFQGGPQSPDKSWLHRMMIQTCQYGGQGGGEWRYTSNVHQIDHNPQIGWSAPNKWLCGWMSILWMHWSFHLILLPALLYGAEQSHTRKLSQSCSCLSVDNQAAAKTSSSKVLSGIPPTLIT